MIATKLLTTLQMQREWLLFVSHLPSSEAAPRMRVWRALRTLGAAILRDGVYLLPHRQEFRAALDEHATTVADAGGSAHVLLCRTADEAEDARFRDLFDRSGDYLAWHEELASLLRRLAALAEPRARREQAAIRRGLDAILSGDFFPGADRELAQSRMEQLVAAVNARFSPDEPTSRDALVPRLDPAAFQGRVWATRRRLWVDRVASAWLIRRRIDAAARFLWLSDPADCPDEAVGFDFDGAAFSHVGERVTFQVLLASFSLETDAALVRLGALIHCLDVGGAEVPEAAGVLALLGAARERCADDDLFLDTASALFDDLHASFSTPREGQQ